MYICHGMASVVIITSKPSEKMAAVVKKMAAVVKVGGDQAHLVPMFLKVGGDASHKSQGMTAPTIHPSIGLSL